MKDITTFKADDAINYLSEEYLTIEDKKAKELYNSYINTDAVISSFKDNTMMHTELHTVNNCITKDGKYMIFQSKYNEDPSCLYYDFLNKKQANILINKLQEMLDVMIEE